MLLDRLQSDCIISADYFTVKRNVLGKCMKREATKSTNAKQLLILSKKSFRSELKVCSLAMIFIYFIYSFKDVNRCFHAEFDLVHSLTF